MLKGLLVFNRFLTGNKFSEMHNFILETAKNEGIDLYPITNSDLLLMIDSSKNKIINLTNNPDFILFWDKDIRLAQGFESIGIPVFNSSKAVEICDDKSLMHLFLSQKGIVMPKTIICPKTYEGINYNNTDFLEKVLDSLGLPLVVKESFGSFGKQVFLIKSKEELEKILLKEGHKSLIFQEYIKFSHGKDIRIQVVGGEEIVTLYRYSTNGDFRANLTLGGSMEKYTPTKIQKDLALKACKIINLDFAGVDILFGKNDEPILCEVNSNAHIINIYNCTGINVARSILSYIKDRIV